MDDPAELCIHESDIPNECFEPIFDEAKPKHVELHPATLRFLFCMAFSVYEVIRVACLVGLFTLREKPVLRNSLDKAILKIIHVSFSGNH